MTTALDLSKYQPAKYPLSTKKAYFNKSGEKLRFHSENAVTTNFTYYDGPNPDGPFMVARFVYKKKSIQ